MKQIFLFTLLLVFISSCKSYVQLFETQSIDCKTIKDSYVYENDTVKITYSLWSEKGLMIFSVSNKLNKPLYIDWKKSSYIDHSTKLNYWEDEEISRTTSINSGYYYNGEILPSGFAISESVTSSSTNRIKRERITFIPPKSSYNKYQYYIIPISYFKMNVNTKPTIVPRNDNGTKTKIYEQNYSIDNTPISFRNFLTCSCTEDFKNEFYIDNSFFVTRITEMDRKHFELYKIDNKSKYELDNDLAYVHYFPFKNGTSFYLSIPNGSNISSRKRYE